MLNLFLFLWSCTSFAWCFFAVICLKERPFFSDVNKVVVISLVLAGVIYVANILLGEGANFWYLMDKPAADTIMNFFPEPPYHLLVTTPVAISVFYLIYLPYVISDALKKVDLDISTWNDHVKDTYLGIKDHLNETPLLSSKNSINYLEFKYLLRLRIFKNWFF
ncbi:MAG: hypothetical protein CM15mP127_08600 [Gammaproteobacteria bacterium]|nr:MAG: hypothetical protein CM15mP127_08600 [Gammaproteobacteria bacterium]